MLIFVYNADSGLFNTLTDIAHKVFSPETYACNLCVITHGAVGMRQEWKEFLETLDVPMEFLHRDEFHRKHDMHELPLPAVLMSEEGRVDVLLSAEEIDQCRDIAELKELLSAKLGRS